MPSKVAKISKKWKIMEITQKSHFWKNSNCHAFQTIADIDLILFRDQASFYGLTLKRFSDVLTTFLLNDKAPSHLVHQSNFSHFQVIFTYSLS